MRATVAHVDRLGGACTRLAPDSDSSSLPLLSFSGWPCMPLKAHTLAVHCSTAPCTSARGSCKARNKTAAGSSSSAQPERSNGCTCRPGHSDTHSPLHTRLLGMLVAAPPRLCSLSLHTRECNMGVTLATASTRLRPPAVAALGYAMSAHTRMHSGH